ncbi:hypothetical protein [Labrys neptuniae]
MGISDILLWGGPWAVRSPWKYDTSEEESGSVYVTGGTGRLYFINANDGSKFSIQYDFLSAGVAKGPPLNYAKSFAQDDSGGLTHVRCREGRYFGPESFPCNGLLLSLGATPGVFGPSFMDHGANGTIFFFGAIPWAGIVTWGKFSSILPSIGPSAGIVRYSDPVVDAGDLD